MLIYKVQVVNCSAKIQADNSNPIGPMPHAITNEELQKADGGFQVSELGTNVHTECIWKV